MNKRHIILSTVGTVLLVGGIGAVSALNQPQKSGADTSPVTTQLQQQQDELNNHEARITNTENTLGAVVAKTGTDTTTVVQVPVPTVSTPKPATVTAYKQIPLDAVGNIDCLYTYSDGTQNQWHWTTVNPQGSWQTDSNGNGQWAPTSTSNGSCDITSIGVPKNS